MADEGLPGANTTDDPTGAAGPPDPASAAADRAALDGADARPRGDRLLRDADRPRRAGARVPWRRIRDARVDERPPPSGRPHPCRRRRRPRRPGRARHPPRRRRRQRHAGRPVTRHAGAVAVGRPGPRRRRRHRELRPRRRHADRGAARGHRRAPCFTAGDNAYEIGSAQEFANCYDPTWGRFKDRTIRPAAGNHDWLTPGRRRAIATTSAPPRSTTPATPGTRTTSGRGT